MIFKYFGDIDCWGIAKWNNYQWIYYDDSESFKEDSFFSGDFGVKFSSLDEVLEFIEPDFEQIPESNKYAQYK